MYAALGPNGGNNGFLPGGLMFPALKSRSYGKVPRMLYFSLSRRTWTG